MVIDQNFPLFNLFIILATYFIIWLLLKEFFWPLRIFISGNPDLRVEASANELLLYKGHTKVNIPPMITILCCWLNPRTAATQKTH